MSRRLHSALREATIGAAALACAACGVDTGSDAPAGGPLAFVAALESGDAVRVWDRLSPEVQQVVADGHAALQATDAEIASLQPSDQSDTRARTGIARFGALDGPPALLGALLQFDALPALDADSPYHDGVQPRDVLEVAPGVALVCAQGWPGVGGPGVRDGSGRRRPVAGA